ncbi:MAG: hypothetical protein HC774_03045, partial [Sphingomonadales bacterium]|nr:hypothetical protein [Sphingomonadales bacterium]
WWRRAALDDRVARIRAALANRPHVFNLGHGIVPDCPIAHVDRMVMLARQPLAQLLERRA